MIFEANNPRSVQAKYFTACCSLVVYDQSPGARNSCMLAISRILLESHISAPVMVIIT